MPTITPVIPSGSTNGKPIKIAASATAGTTFHTATSTAGAMDEVFLYVSNTDSSERAITVELGGVTSPDNLVKMNIPAGETACVIPGVRLNGGVVIAVFASAANVCTMFGNINRYA